MREIKFRGKKASTGEWVYGSLITNPSGPHTIVQIRLNPVHNGIIQGWCFGVDRDSVGQFTGLHDKNGKEIYDGDVVDWSGDKGVVVFNSTRWAIRIKSLRFPQSFHEWSLKDMEVIGAIHENQELLTK